MESAKKNWYVVNTYSGHENKVRINLERRIENLDMQDYIFRVIVAEHPEPVLKDGLPTDKVRMKNTYPGYLFVEMIMSDEAWYVVRNTPGVTGFIGSSGRGEKPFPVPKEQIDSVLKSVGVIEANMFSDYKPGDFVKILRGPLMGSEGVIQSVDPNKSTAKVSAVFFGRETIVEVDFSDVDKAR